MRKHLPVPATESQDITTGPYVFLGGTINGSEWRAKLEQLLTVKSFNPITADWGTDDVLRENVAKMNSQVQLFVITPKQLGFYSIAEMMEAVTNINRSTEQKVAIVFLKEDDGAAFDDHQLASNRAIEEMVVKYMNVEVFDSLETLADFLNKYLAVQKGEVVGHQ